MKDTDQKSSEPRKNLERRLIEKQLVGQQGRFEVCPGKLNKEIRESREERKQDWKGTNLCRRSDHKKRIEDRPSDANRYSTPDPYQEIGRAQDLEDLSSGQERFHSASHQFAIRHLRHRHHRYHLFSAVWQEEPRWALLLGISFSFSWIWAAFLNLVKTKQETKEVKVRAREKTTQ
jgi:hypothetical protein